MVYSDCTIRVYHDNNYCVRGDCSKLHVNRTFANFIGPGWIANA